MNITKENPSSSRHRDLYYRGDENEEGSSAGGIDGVYPGAERVRGMGHDPDAESTHPVLMDDIQTVQDLTVVAEPVAPERNLASLVRDRVSDEVNAALPYPVENMIAEQTQMIVPATPTVVAKEVKESDEQKSKREKKKSKREARQNRERKKMILIGLFFGFVLMVVVAVAVMMTIVILGRRDKTVESPTQLDKNSNDNPDNDDADNKVAEETEAPTIIDTTFPTSEPSNSHHHQHRQSGTGI